MNKLKRIAPLMALSLLAIAASAQPQQDFMRSNGKIYVVMAVVITIVIGLFIYLLNLDRKMSKMEKKN